MWVLTIPGSEGNRDYSFLWHGADDDETRRLDSIFPVRETLEGVLAHGRAC